MFLTGCAGNQQPLPPPTASASGVDTAVKYSQWSNGQLELKRAQLRHELDRGYFVVGPPLPMLIAASDRSGRQVEVEGIEAELKPISRCVMELFCEKGNFGGIILFA